ncbi:MAG: AraC family transcriptional regulator [Planctomycetales bacterium]|nr:AraC family transcriptional regulator [Planctomycetales bacterium]
MERKKSIDKNPHLALEGHVSESKYFFFDTDPRKKQKLAIVFGGFEKCAPDFEIKRKTYPYYVIEVPTGGRCRLEIGTRRYELKKGSLGGLVPGVPHHYKCDKSSPMEHIFVAFTGSDAPLLFEKSSLQNGHVAALSKPADVFYLAEAILKKGLEKTELSHHLCCVYLRALLMEQGSGMDLTGRSDTLAMASYRKCRKYIDEHFSSLFSPLEVAQACSVNIRYLSRLFKKYGESTPHEYIMRLKLNKAGSLLLTTALSVREVGYLVGFEDPYHFSRNFKKFHGLSPRQYRGVQIEKPLQPDKI